MANRKILILGANGFIGSSLVWKILTDTDWEVVGADLSDNKITESLKNPRFKFSKKELTLSSVGALNAPPPTFISGYLVFK